MEKVVEKSCMEYEELKRVQPLYGLIGSTLWLEVVQLQPYK